MFVNSENYFVNQLKGNQAEFYLRKCIENPPAENVNTLEKCVIEFFFDLYFIDINEKRLTTCSSAMLWNTKERFLTNYLLKQVHNTIWLSACTLSI